MLWQSVILLVSPPILDSEVLSLDVSGLGQAPEYLRYNGAIAIRRSTAQKPNC